MPKGNRHVVIRENNNNTVHRHQYNYDAFLFPCEISDEQSCEIPQQLQAALKDDDLVKFKKATSQLDIKNYKIHTYSLLHLATANLAIDICNYLLNEEVDANERSEYQQTTFDALCTYDQLTTSKFLAFNEIKKPIQVKILKLLINHGLNLETINSRGFTPVLIAANRGRLDLVKVFVEAGANINYVFEYKGESITCLHIAIRNQHIELFKYLVSQNNIKLDMEIKTIHNNYTYKSYLFSALLSRNETIISELIKKMAVITEVDYLHFAICTDQSEKIITLLISCMPKEVINTKKALGMNALHIAVYYNKYEAVRCLLPKIDIDAVDDEGGNALHILLEAKKIDILLAKLLIKAGIRNIPDARGFSITELAIIRDAKEILSALDVDDKAIKEICRSNGNGDSILHVAIKWLLKEFLPIEKALSIIKKLIKDYPDSLNSLNKDKDTVWHYLIKNINKNTYFHVILIEILKANVDLRLTDAEGNNILHLLLKINEDYFLEVTKKLIDLILEKENSFFLIAVKNNSKLAPYEIIVGNQNVNVCSAYLMVKIRDKIKSIKGEIKHFFDSIGGFLESVTVEDVLTVKLFFYGKYIDLENIFFTGLQKRIVEHEIKAVIKNKQIEMSVMFCLSSERRKFKNIIYDLSEVLRNHLESQNNSAVDKQESSEEQQPGVSKIALSIVAENQKQNKKSKKQKKKKKNNSAKKIDTLKSDQVDTNNNNQTTPTSVGFFKPPSGPLIEKNMANNLPVGVQPLLGLIDQFTQLIDLLSADGNLIDDIKTSALVGYLILCFEAHKKINTLLPKSNIPGILDIKYITRLRNLLRHLYEYVACSDILNFIKANALHMKIMREEEFFTRLEAIAKTKFQQGEMFNISPISQIEFYNNFNLAFRNLQSFGPYLSSANTDEIKTLHLGMALLNMLSFLGENYRRYGYHTDFGYNRLTSKQKEVLGMCKDIHPETGHDPEILFCLDNGKIILNKPMLEKLDNIYQEFCKHFVIEFCIDAAVPNFN